MTEPATSEPTEPATSEPTESRMTFWEHLEELRSRLIRIILGMLVGTSAAWFFKENIFAWLAHPYFATGQTELHNMSAQGAFWAYVKISGVTGFILALPITFYQFWAFISPGLYPKEKHLALPFVISSVFLFSAGAYFAWRISLPMVLKFFINYTGSVGESGLEIANTVRLEEYLDLTTRIILAFGFVFELPVVVFFLTLSGVIDHKHLIRFARYFVVLAFVLGAVITPPDPASQFLMAIPLCILYTLSIGIAWLFSRSRRKTATAA